MTFYFYHIIKVPKNGFLLCGEHLKLKKLFASGEL
jgi:hypothetical protein